ncbi:uncharacterized protein [Nicotiana tomentosiformis]|uniref:uncharacterized protein n=1 Tax=Nicotiana tomentosiformis TaxID=4098 RepID=UPI00388C7A59
MPARKLAKWKILLSEFDIVYINKKTIKGQALDDHLVENLVDKDYEPLTTYFPNEEVLFTGEDITKSYPGWRMFFDGATNFEGVGIGAVLISESGQHYPASAKISGLLSINTSSSRRMDYQERQDPSIPTQCKRASKKFKKIEFRHIPRVQNKFVDALDLIIHV